MIDDGDRGLSVGWLSRGASCIAGARGLVNGKALARLLAACCCLLLLAAEGPAGAESPFPRDLILQNEWESGNGSARLLAWDGEARVLAASQALSGVSFFHLAGGGAAPVTLYDPERPTLDVLPLGESRYLLARRFGTLELVEVSGFGDGAGAAPAIKSLAEWDVEGMPNHLVRTGDLLLVSAGPAGVLVYEWPTVDSVPRLRGRYPIVDYTKQIFAAPDEMLVIADNFDYGMQVLNLADPMRPEYVTHQTGDFVDTLDGFGELVAVGLRRNGVVFLDISDAAAPRRVQYLPLESNQGMVQRVRFNPKGDLLVSEGASGARLVSVQQGEDPEADWNARIIGSWPAEAGHDVRDGIFLGEEWIALSEGSGRISFHQLQDVE